MSPVVMTCRTDRGDPSDREEDVAAAGDLDDQADHTGVALFGR
jgi:hypothetical protein